MAMTLGYWHFHRLAHEKYRIGDSPNYDRSQWLSKKFKLGLDFPNLPYLINGAHKLTQCKATLDSTAHKHNVSGETEKIYMAVMESRAMDTADDLARVCHHHHSEKMKFQYLKEIPENMKLYSEFLETRTWFAGDKLTYVGFLACTLYLTPTLFGPNCLKLYNKQTILTFCVIVFSFFCHESLHQNPGLQTSGLISSVLP
uniref:glutathione transferase n=1 Tax=Moschus moschiferus TaxID=68415 RepID=A0A8C6FLK3_MOSMO